jgi:predicted anti-sigma-YlaC factor YlaD
VQPPGNPTTGPRDNLSVDCETCRETLSARLDGETEPATAEAADSHLRGCARCRSWQERAATLNRTLRVRQVAPTPDLSDRILAAAPVPARREWWWRFALAVIAAAQLWLGVSQLFGAGDGVSPMPMAMPGDMTAHLFDESTAWNIALGLGLAWVAWRVRAAAGMLAVLGVFLVVLAAFCAHDLVVGDVTVARVASHGLLPIGFALAWMVHRRCARPGDPAPAPPLPVGRHGHEMATGPDEVADPAPARPERRRHLGTVSRRRAA